MLLSTSVTDSSSAHQYAGMQVRDMLSCKPIRPRRNSRSRNHFLRKQRFCRVSLIASVSTGESPASRYRSESCNPRNQRSSLILHRAPFLRGAPSFEMMDTHADDLGANWDK